MSNAAGGEEANTKGGEEDRQAPNAFLGAVFTLS